MTVAGLLSHWGKRASGRLTPEPYPLHLPLEDAAKLEALAELFPRRTREQLMGDLLSAALDELVASFPYIQGSKIIARDEQGDPVFEDTGFTPRYLQLVNKHMAEYRKH